MCGSDFFSHYAQKELNEFFGGREVYKHFTPDGGDWSSRRSNYLVRPTSGRLFD